LDFVVPDKRALRAPVRDPYAAAVIVGALVDGFPSTTPAGVYGSRFKAGTTGGEGSDANGYSVGAPCATIRRSRA
jgi:hypothetical protein